MDLRHLRYFVAIAEQLSFTRAARELGIAQPPLSQQIRGLEQELGCELFERRPHGVLLTEAGNALLPEARATLAQAERAQEIAVRAGRGLTGTLRVGFTSSASFHPTVARTLRAFNQRYPDVQLTLFESPTTALIAKLNAQQLDAAFLRPGAEDPPQLLSYELAREPMLAVLPVGHALSKARSVKLARLRDERWVLFPRLDGPGLFEEIVSACLRAGFSPQLGQVAPQLTSIGNFVAAGLGVSMVPEALTQVRVRGVRYLALSQGPSARLTLAVRELRPAVRNFVALAQA